MSKAKQVFSAKVKKFNTFPNRHWLEASVVGTWSSHDRSWCSPQFCGKGGGK